MDSFLPLVASCLLRPSGPLRPRDPTPLFTTLDQSLPRLAISENGQHGLVTTLLTALDIRFVRYIARLNLVHWNDALPEERDGICDQRLESPGSGLLKFRAGQLSAGWISKFIRLWPTLNLD